jgi:predicted transcriptional regulator
MQFVQRLPSHPEGQTNMKASMLIPALAACALWGPVVSAQEKAPAMPAMSMDMDKQVSQVEQDMKNLHLQMDKIHKTTDPKARQKLMDAHMRAMQETMMDMRGMGGPMMKGGSKHDGMKMGAQKGGMTDDDMLKNQEMMSKRLDMMQMMMEQMMQRDQAAQMAPAPSSGGMGGDM